MLQTDLSRKKFERLWPKKAEKIRRVIARDSKRVANQLCDTFIKKLFFVDPPNSNTSSSV